ncbi:MAG: hypothetical protein E3J72_19800 [Planctomycetota bacterium]|nr:MAG: hypothetical protein E3J72_19800 [Planctomycetota bacterium]
MAVFREYIVGGLLSLSAVSCTLYWIYYAVRVTFILLRREHTPREKENFPRPVIICIYFICGSLVLIWSVGSVAALGYESIGLLALFGFPIVVVSSFIGIIYLRLPIMKVVAAWTFRLSFGLLAVLLLV